ncbi:MAG: chalcone isomerase family protein [Myxococcota bacterium]
MRSTKSVSKLSRRALLPLAALLTLLFALPESALARRCEGVNMRNSIEVDGQTLVLNGMGVREATVFNVNVYVAGLYLPEANSDGGAILSANGLKRIVLHFVRDVTREDMEEALRDSFGNAGVANQIGRFARMLPEEINEGTVLTFTHRPGAGLETRVGRRRSGQINGDAFATAFFRIFVGPNPPNRGLKRGLLGGACG